MRDRGQHFLNVQKHNVCVDTQIPKYRSNRTCTNGHDEYLASATSSFHIYAYLENVEKDAL